MSSFGVGLGSWKKGGRVADSSAVTENIRRVAQGQADATYADTQKKNPFRLSSAILNGYSYNSAVLVKNRIQGTSVTPTPTADEWLNITGTQFAGTGDYQGGYDIAFDGTKWVAVGFNTVPTTDYNILYSSTGLAWNSASGTFSAGMNARGHGVAADGTGNWVVVGYNPGGVIIKYSPDGETYTDARNVAGLDVGYDVATNGTGRWIAVGFPSVPGSSIVFSTDNGDTWTNATSGAFLDGGYGIAYGGGTWIAVGDNTNAVLMSSSILKSKDGGVNWTSKNGLTNQMLGIATNGTGTWVAVGGPPNKIMYSTDDGESWTAATGDTFTDIALGVTYYGGTWIAVGIDTAGKTIKYSSNGQVWSNATSGEFTGQGNAVAYGDGKWIAVGFDGTGGGNTIKYKTT